MGTLKQTLVLGILCAVFAASAAMPAAAGDNQPSQYQPAGQGHPRALDFGLKPSVVLPRDSKGCFEPCSPARTVVYSGAEDSAYYPAEFEVNLVGRGPVSFGVAGRRLRMEFDF